MFARFLVPATVVICLVSSPAPAAAQALTQRDYLSELTGVHPSVLPGGRVVISLDAAGDLKGRLTISLTPGEQGVKGTWAFVATYLENLRADGTSIREDDHVSHDHDDPDTPAMHREYARIRRDGVITGTVTSATVRRTADGQVIGLELAELVATGGTRTFKAVTGSGRIGPWPSLPGSLTLLLSF